ncbi:MAG: hypothetical protein GY937_03755 [bacterium]|nr:hypothetical protein [bacterium]
MVLRLMEQPEDIALDPASTADAIEILTKIDGLYTKAWNQLLLYVTLLFVVIGVFVPVVQQWFHRRSLRDDEDRLRASLDESLKESMSEARATIAAAVDERIAALG